MESSHNIINGIIIYLVIPLIGLICFFLLKKRMITNNIIERPTLSLFMMFFTYGGLLTLVLTAFFWEWSGAASIGVLYLLFLAPIAMLLIAYKQYKKRKTSVYHKWMFYLGTGYFMIAPLTFIILFHVVKN